MFYFYLKICLFVALLYREMNAKILINQQNQKTENPQWVDNSLDNKHYRKINRFKKGKIKPEIVPFTTVMALFCHIMPILSLLNTTILESR